MLMPVALEMLILEVLDCFTKMVWGLGGRVFVCLLSVFFY